MELHHARCCVIGAILVASVATFDASVQARGLTLSGTFSTGSQTQATNGDPINRVMQHTPSPTTAVMLAQSPDVTDDRYGVDSGVRMATHPDVRDAQEKRTKQRPFAVVGRPAYFDISPPLRLIRPVEMPAQGFREILEPEERPRLYRKGPPPGRDPVLQTQVGKQSAFIDGPQFSGVGNLAQVVPPDPNGDVGTDHYIQMVNLHTAIYTKAGALVWGPNSSNTIWSGFGGFCQTTNSGDPIVLWDPLAKRWLVSQFAFSSIFGPFYECIAISITPDPLGGWYRYAFKISDTKLNDYPHLGVWPDGYYMSINQFKKISGGYSYEGAGAVVFEREKMLIGDPLAAFHYFDLGASSPYYGMLPSDLDGRAPPPAGSPNYFAEVDDSSWIGGTDTLRLWEFHVDWATPTNSTFGIGVNYAPNKTLAVASFTPLISNLPTVPQFATPSKLGAHPRGLLARLAYRNHGTHEALFLNHAVDAGSGRAGVRWYEVRDPGGSPPVIHQQSTWAGASGDTLHRFVGSIAQDGAGNVALGYSAANVGTYPSIRRTGRLASDTLNLMMPETTLVTGLGSQTHLSGRWGDYTYMTVDPIDDCTFWYTNEYYSATSSAAWETAILSFSHPATNCPRKSDVWIKDKAVDEGGEYDPATVGLNMWESEDIWVRTNGCDGGLVHQNAEFGQTNCVYVRLHNRDQPASGTLDVRYANAGLGLAWPTDWQLISTASASPAANATVVIGIPWSPPAPGATGHFCLLARWLSPSDPMTWAETSDVNFNTRFNNNIAWKNIHIVNLLALRPGGDGFIVRNTLRETAHINIVVGESDATLKDRFLAHGNWHQQVSSASTSIFRKLLIKPGRT